MMKLTIVLVCAFYFVSSDSSKCKENEVYRIQPVYPFQGRFSPWICTSFTVPESYLNILESSTITCSNVSSSVFLNHDFKTHYYPQDLVITDSTISKFPSNTTLSTFSTIRKLVLKNLGIEEVSPGAFDGLETLEKLDLSSNKLTQTPSDVFDDLSNLQVLDLSNNFINNVDRSSVFGLVGLKELYLNKNKLTILHDNTFKDLVALEVLDISDNPLEELQDIGFGHLDKLIARNLRLKQFDIDLSNSSLAEIEMPGGILETINFDNLPSLKRLDLSNNRLRKVENWDNLKCDQVSLAFNNITEVEDVPKNVEILNLSNNQIKSLKNNFGDKNESLESLDLSFNQISSIDGVFWRFDHLKILNLKHNNIKNLRENAFVNCSSLKYVDLSYNEISEIESQAFVGTHELNLLNISHNHLHSLNFAMLPKENKLEHLCVDVNDIARFDTKKCLDHFSHLKFVSLIYNPLPCENLKDALYLLRSREVEVIDAFANPEDIICRAKKTS